MRFWASITFDFKTNKVIDFHMIHLPFLFSCIAGSNNGTLRANFAKKHDVSILTLEKVKINFSSYVG